MQKLPIEVAVAVITILFSALIALGNYTIDNSKRLSALESTLEKVENTQHDRRQIILDYSRVSEAIDSNGEKIDRAIETIIEHERRISGIEAYLSD